MGVESVRSSIIEMTRRNMDENSAGRSSNKPKLIVSTWTVVSQLEAYSMFPDVLAS